MSISSSRILPEPHKRDHWEKRKAELRQIRRPEAPATKNRVRLY